MVVVVGGGGNGGGAGDITLAAIIGATILVLYLYIKTLEHI